MTLKGWDSALFRKRVFQALIFLAPTQAAIHLWPDWALVFGIRVDYLAVTFYLTDALILLYLATSFSFKRLNARSPLFVCALLFFALINTATSSNHWAALFKWLKFFEMAALAFAISKDKELRLKDWFLKPLAFSLGLFSIIGVLQFFAERSLGGKILYLLGERKFFLGDPGIATASLWGVEKLRAYSTFSHPNSFAAYLVAASPLLLLFKKKPGYWGIIMALVLTAIVLTFSKSAILALLLCPVLLLVKIKSPKQHPQLLFLIAAIVFSFLWPLLTRMGQSTLPNTLVERSLLAQESLHAVSQQSVFGIGLNNIFEKLTSLRTTDLTWLLQPVHNIFLLSFVETGFVGLLLFSYLFFKAFEKSSAKEKIVSSVLSTSLFAVVLTGFFDHHWLTLQQNQLLFSIVLGISFRNIGSN